jgi:hypothetical protein
MAQREDLEAAGVGQDRPVPPHEAVQAAQLVDQVGARAEMQVVRVAEQDLGSESLELLRVDGLDRRLGSHRHERRCAQLASRRLEDAGAGGTVGRLELERGHARAASSNQPAIA